MRVKVREFVESFASMFEPGWGLSWKIAFSVEEFGITFSVKFSISTENIREEDLCAALFST